MRGLSTLLRTPPLQQPADRGLTTVGFLMYLGGIITLFAAFIFVMPVVLSLLNRPAEGVSGFILLALAMTRSELHRRAGRSLIYGQLGGPFVPVRRYVRFALLQAAVTAALLVVAGMPVLFLIIITLYLCVWPATLAWLALPMNVLRSADPTLPEGCDSAYEQLAVLMVVAAAMGVTLLSGLVTMLLAADVGGPAVISGLIILMLAARCYLHIQAALLGVRGASPERFEDQAFRYGKFGLMTSILAAVGVAVIFLIIGAHPAFTLFSPVLVVVFLGLWPHAVSQFIRARSLAHLELEGGGTMVRRERAPDSGFTALGWVLLAFNGSNAVASLFGHYVWGLAEATSRGSSADSVTQGALWLGTTAAVFGVWAGIELVRLSSRRTLATLLYGLIGIMAGVLETERVAGDLELSTHFLRQSVAELAQLVGNLALPLAAVLLIARASIASARVVDRR